MNSTRLATLRRSVATPGYARSVLARRLAAAVLVALAASSALQARQEKPEVAVFARHVAAGTTLSLGDIELRRLDPGGLPERALTTDDATSLAGRIVVAGAEAGEVVTESRLLGESLAAQLVGETTTSTSAEPAHMVPLKVAEPDVVALLHHGDTVSVIAASSEQDTSAPSLSERSPAALPESTVIAAGGRVIATSLVEEERSGKPATILLALPATLAAQVAAASLSQPLTVVITGARATGETGHPAIAEQAPEGSEAS